MTTEEIKTMARFKSRDCWVTLISRSFTKNNNFHHLFIQKCIKNIVSPLYGLLSSLPWYLWWSLDLKFFRLMRMRILRYTRLTNGISPSKIFCASYNLLGANLWRRPRSKFDNKWCIVYPSSALWVSRNIWKVFLDQHILMKLMQSFSFLHNNIQTRDYVKINVLNSACIF